MGTLSGHISGHTTWRSIICKLSKIVLGVLVADLEQFLVIVGVSLVVDEYVQVDGEYPESGSRV